MLKITKHETSTGDSQAVMNIELIKIKATAFMSRGFGLALDE